MNQLRIRQLVSAASASDAGAAAATDSSSSSSGSDPHHSPILRARLGYEEPITASHSAVLVCADEVERDFLIE